MPDQTRLPSPFLARLYHRALAAPPGEGPLADAYRHGRQHGICPCWFRTGTAAWAYCLAGIVHRYQEDLDPCRN